MKATKRTVFVCRIRDSGRSLAYSLLMSLTFVHKQISLTFNVSCVIIDGSISQPRCCSTCFNWCHCPTATSWTSGRGRCVESDGSGASYFVSPAVTNNCFPMGSEKNEVFPFKVYNAKVKNLQCSRDKAGKTASELLSSLNHSVSNLPIAVVSKMHSNL